LKGKASSTVWKECPQCKGRGEIPLFRFYCECPKCKGRGEIRVLEIIKEKEKETVHSDPNDEYGWVMFPTYKVDDD